jgi:hypothetical protein
MLGCANPADGAAGQPGKAGEGGEKGTDGPIYLSGSVTTDGINDALASGTSVVFAGVTQSDAGTVIIPANRTGGAVKLVGTAAYTTFDTGGGVLIVEDVSSVYGNGGLVSGGTTSPVIVPEGVEASGDSVIPLQDGTDTIDTSGTAIAVKVDKVTINTTATGTTNILNTELTTQNLYVVGDVEVSAAIGGAATITVTGDAEVTTAQTAAVVWDIKGNLDAKKLPTTGTLTVGGNAVFAEAVTGITGAIAIGGNATFSNTLTTGTGAVTVGSLEVTGAASLGAGGLTVNGAAEFKSTLTNAAASTATFNGATTIDTYTSGGAATVIAGTGSVTIAKTLGDISTNTVVIKNTGGVTLTAESTIASDIKATKATIKGVAAGLTIGGTTLKIPANGSIDVTAEGASIVTTGTANKVTITGATLKAGIYTGTDGRLSLSTTAEIEVADGGMIEIAGAGNLELTGATSKVVLKEGGAIDVKADTGNFGEASQTDTKVTVAASSAPTATKATITEAPTKVWTVTSVGTGGTGATNIILGTLKLAITGTSDVNAVVGASDSGAVGKLITGTGTVITFIGS